jgi:hypothetical protein
LNRDVLASFLRTKRPPHAFVLSRTRLVYVGPQDPKKAAPASGAPAAVRVLARNLPPEAFTDGPGGVPVAGSALAGALARLLAEAAVKITAASLAVSDDFVRVLTVDVEEPETHPKEVDEILVWKYGRSFGEPVPPLRLSWQTAGPGATGTRVVAIAAPDEAIVSWEAPFEKAGIRVGALETASLAVSSLGARAVGGEGLVVWADGEVATTLFFSKGQLRFLRTRTAADAEDALQEIRLAASFVGAEALAAAPDASEVVRAGLSGPCAAGPAGSRIVEALHAFRVGEGAPAPAPLTLAGLVPGTTVMPAAAAEETAVLVALGAMAGAE